MLIARLISCTVSLDVMPKARALTKASSDQVQLLSGKKVAFVHNLSNNKTEVTSVMLVLFKYVMFFETLTKVDQLTEIVRFG